MLLTTVHVILKSWFIFEKISFSYHNLCNVLAQTNSTEQYHTYETKKSAACAKIRSKLLEPEADDYEPQGDAQRQITKKVEGNNEYRWTIAAPPVQVGLNLSTTTAAEGKRLQYYKPVASNISAEAAT